MVEMTILNSQNNLRRKCLTKVSFDIGTKPVLRPLQSIGVHRWLATNLDIRYQGQFLVFVTDHRVDDVSSIVEIGEAIL